MNLKLYNINKPFEPSNINPEINSIGDDFLKRVMMNQRQE